MNDPNAYHVEVRDSGSGIPKEHLERIFQDFSSVQSDSDTRHAGLGLAVCRHLVHLHGGRIFAESAEDGARFIFILPFGQPKIPGISRERIQSNKKINYDTPVRSVR